MKKQGYIVAKYKRFSDLLSTKPFVISAELTPPVHFELHGFMQKIELINEYVDVIQINDLTIEKAHISNLIVSDQCKIAGIEVVVQLSMKDKSKQSFQSELLGLAALGLENIVITSDDTTTPLLNIKKDTTTNQALRHISTLCTDGELICGHNIKPYPNFCCGITIKIPTIEKIEESLLQIESYLMAGSQFFQLKCGMQIETLNYFMEEISKKKLHHKAYFIVVIDSQPENESQSLKTTAEFISKARKLDSLSGIHIQSENPKEWVPQIIETSGLGGQLFY